jgi:hypothetical protein
MRDLSSRDRSGAGSENLSSTVLGNNQRILLINCSKTMGRAGGDRLAARSGGAAR